MPKELLFSITRKDLIRQTFRCGGNGGQNIQKRDTGVRFIHPDSGAVGESRTHRTQAANEKEAFNRLVHSDKFQTWVKMQASAKIQGFRDAEHKVEQMMEPENLKVEVMNEEGKWEIE